MLSILEEVMNIFQPMSVTPEKILKSFHINDDSLKIIKSKIMAEFELGLKEEDKATVKMLVTYVRELSRGDETGTYLALDLGGTHFRVLLVEMEGGKAKVTAVTVHTIPDELFVTQNGQELFDYIALKLLEFVQTHNLKRRRISLGFTFSFPCKQYGLTQSVLVKWNKGFNVGGVVGTDVVKQLKNALKRQLSGLVEAYIDVVAVINDTTGTLVACANTNKNCRIGLIVGTGFNACYIERLENCDKWPANYNNPKQVIINCEWGAMGDNKENRELDPFRNEFDIEIDKKSVNPMSQTYEKMVSGMYIGELLRVSILKLYRARQIFTEQAESSIKSSKSSQKDALVTSHSKEKSRSQSQKSSSGLPKPPSSTAHSISGHKLGVKNIIDGRHLSMLAKDELNGTQEEAVKIVQILNIATYSKDDLALVIQLASKIMHRSAHLVATGVSALLEKIAKPFTVIGFDGSVIKHHPYFLQEVERKCAHLTPKEYKFEFTVSSDGSGIGAAVVAAALHKERRPLYVLKEGRLFELHYANKTVHSASIEANMRRRACSPAPSVASTCSSSVPSTNPQTPRSPLPAKSPNAPAFNDRPQ